MIANYELIVVGGGVAGISIGVESKRLGLQNSLILEKGSSHSMTIREFYKDGKRVDKEWKGASVETLGSIEFQDGTKESSIEFFDNLIKENELNIKYSSDVESISSDANHFRVATTDGNIYQAKYVVIAIGSMGKPNRPDYPIPPKIKKVVNFNIDSAINGEKLLVVGGGNSAVEYAIELSKISDDVTLTYRKSRFTRVNPENLHNLNLLVESKKIKLKTAMDIERVSESESGVRVHFQHGDFEDYDRIIYSIGGTVPKEFLRKSGVELDEQSKPILSAEFLTSVPKLYIIGDLALKSGGSIALAINHGYLVAEAIAKESRLT